MKIVSIVGARPQFIKAAPVSQCLEDAGAEEFILHTGQHYDHAMSKIFFDELSLPVPHINLNVGSGSHGEQTALMLIGIEQVLLKERPDRILIYGDTNSTLAGALAGSKMGIKVGHVEAGLRSFNRSMPEEINRIVADRCSDLLFCPTETAVRHLKREGIAGEVHLTGDTMYDSVLHFGALARAKSQILKSLGIIPGNYILATLHRPYNTDDPETLHGLLRALSDLNEPVVFPVHPRTKQKLMETAGKSPETSNGIKMIDPVGYIDMLQLEQNARLIVTDSGGIQKEAYFFAVPCITARPETEWEETLDGGWNIVAGSNPERIVELVHRTTRPKEAPHRAFGDGQAAARIVSLLTR